MAMLERIPSEEAIVPFDVGTNWEDILRMSSQQITEYNGPPPPASEWQQMVLRLSTIEREKHEIWCRTEADRLALENQLAQMIVERDERARSYERELGMLKLTTEKQIRDGVSTLRQQIYANEEARKKADTRLEDCDRRRLDAERTVATLLRKMPELKSAFGAKDGEHESEISRVKAERDASYNRTQEHAEERVKAMSSMAREAQDAMYRNMEVVEIERNNLRTRSRRHTELGMSRGEDGGPGGMTVFDAIRRGGDVPLEAIASESVEVRE